MKKLLLILLLSIPVIGFSQVKVDTPKPVYKKVIVLEVNDVNICINGLNELKRLVMYEPNTTADQKVEAYKNIETYISELNKRIKLDSVKIEPPKK